MKRISVFLTACLLAASCSDSTLPDATGKGDFRAINAIPTSGEISFKIEERPIGTANYKEATATTQFDDLSYNFNFEVFYAGQIELTRIASEFLDAVADVDYTFLLTGSLADPTVTILEDEVREFETDGTVFAAKFLHTSSRPGALDFYFADPATTPVLGEQAATLSPGEISASIDFTEGDYVVTLTTAGDPNDVVYRSESTAFIPGISVFVALFDGDANDTAPLIVQALPTRGAAVTMPDPSFAPTVGFINGSMDLGISDIYNDEPLTSRIVQDHDFLAVEDEIDVVSGSNTFYYTPAGSTAAVTLQGNLTAVSGKYHRFYALGVAGALTTDVVIPDRKPLETMVKLTMFSTVNNFNFIDLYVVDEGQSIDEVSASRVGIPQGSQTATVILEAGIYDIYITEVSSKTVLAGPYRVDTALGDIVDFVVVDTVDPAVLDLLFLSGAPVP